MRVKVKINKIKKDILLALKTPICFILFVMGLCFTGLGLWFHNPSWIILGLILPIIGMFYSFSHKAKTKRNWYDQLVKLYLIKIQLPFHIIGYLAIIIALWRNDLLLLFIGLLIKLIGYFVAYIHEEKNLGVLFYFLVPKNKYKIIKKSIRKKK